MAETSCRSCGAPILWRKGIHTGKFNPIDAASNLDGNIHLNEDGTYTVGPCDTKPDAPRYTSHFATCPNAAKHRKAKP